jgi:hypothetical protein
MSSKKIYYKVKWSIRKNNVYTLFDDYCLAFKDFERLLSLDLDNVVLIKVTEEITEETIATGRCEKWR